MLTIGDRFPTFDLKGVVGNDPKTAFWQVTDRSEQGKWKVVFFWPKDFTFVGPTEIGPSINAITATSATPSLRSLDRFRCASAGDRTISLKSLPIAMLSGWHAAQHRARHPRQERGRAHRASFVVDPDGIIRFKMVSDLWSAQSGGGAASPSTPADRRALPLRLAEGRRRPEIYVRERLMSVDAWWTAWETPAPEISFRPGAEQLLGRSRGGSFVAVHLPLAVRRPTGRGRRVCPRLTRGAHRCWDGGADGDEQHLYRFVHLVHAADYKTQPGSCARAMIKPGVDKVDFEL
jgi:peroxiredoxin (alkyl hydroperoxide reductase subunit C)